MAYIVSRSRRRGVQYNTKANTRASFLRSQLILFNSRKKYGLLYSVATIAGLFCIPGILNLMSSETGTQLLIQRIVAAPFITLMIAVGMYILNDLIDADIDNTNIKNIAIALFYMLCSMLGITSIYGIGLAINNPIVAIHTMTMSGIMIFVGSIVNDLGDIKGDKAAGRRTIPIVLGGENTVRVLIILLVSMQVISWILYVT